MVSHSIHTNLASLPAAKVSEPLLSESTDGECLQNLLDPNQLLLSESNRLWALDLQTQSTQLCWSFSPQPGFTFEPSTVILSPKGDKLYYLALNGTGFDAVGQIIQVDTESKSEKVLLEKAGLNRMTSVSPDGTKALVFYTPSSEHDWVFCVLNIEDSLCPSPEHPPFNPNEFFWIDDSSFVALSFKTMVEGIGVYTIHKDGLLTRRFIEQNTWHFYTSDLIRDQQSLLIAASIEKPCCQIALLKVDLNTLEISEMPYAPSAYNAAFAHIGVSPDRHYMYYARGNHMDIVDFTTGKSIGQQDNMWQFEWSPDSKKIYAFDDFSQDHRLHLMSYDILTGKLSDIADFAGDTHFVNTPQFAGA